MGLTLLLGALLRIGAISAAGAVAANHGSAPPAPHDIPEPLASSCRPEAQEAYAEMRAKEGASAAAQWIEADYELVAHIDARYVDYQRQGQAEMGESKEYGAANYRFRACLYGVRLQMLGGSVPQLGTYTHK